MYSMYLVAIVVHGEYEKERKVTACSSASSHNCKDGNFISVDWAKNHHRIITESLQKTGQDRTGWDGMGWDGMGWDGDL